MVVLTIGLMFRPHPDNLILQLYDIFLLKVKTIVLTVRVEMEDSAEIATVDLSVNVKLDSLGIFVKKVGKGYTFLFIFYILKLNFIIIC